MPSSKTPRKDENQTTKDQASKLRDQTYQQSSGLRFLRALRGSFSKLARRPERMRRAMSGKLLLIVRPYWEQVETMLNHSLIDLGREAGGLLAKEG